MHYYCDSDPVDELSDRSGRHSEPGRETGDGGETGAGDGGEAGAGDGGEAGAGDGESGRTEFGALVSSSAPAGTTAGEAGGEAGYRAGGEAYRGYAGGEAWYQEPTPAWRRPRSGVEMRTELR